MFGSPETTTGGRALKFYSSVRLDIRRIGQIKDGDQVVGNRTKVTVVKNKIAPPFRKVEFDILFNRGISREGELLDQGMEKKIVIRSGTWYSLKHPEEGEIRLGQGQERARRFLIDNPDLADALDGWIRTADKETADRELAKEETARELPAKAPPAAEKPEVKGKAPAGKA
jgi:recombination protein RecA